MRTKWAHSATRGTFLKRAGYKVARPPLVLTCARARLSETYQYYDGWGFCEPETSKKYKLEFLGEVLNGDRLVNVPFQLRFREDKEDEALCTKELSKKQIDKLRGAIKKDFYFQMYFDDLPLWGFLGKVRETGPHGRHPCGHLPAIPLMLTRTAFLSTRASADGAPGRHQALPAHAL